MILFHSIGWKVNIDTDRSALDKRLSMPISWNYKPVLRSQLEVFNVLKAMLMTIVLCLVSEAGWVEAQPLEKTGLDPVAKAGPRYKIGIIDTGYKPEKATKATTEQLCKTGHYDYLTDTPNLVYVHEHGTRIMNLISQKLGKDVDYCFVVYQVSTRGVDAFPTVMADALTRAVTERLAAVNISFNSLPDEFNKIEDAAYRAADANNVVVFLASGNSSYKMDKGCRYYPACYGPYKNLIVVGGRQYENPKEIDKSYGHGSRVSVYAPTWYQDTDGVIYQGTSYAAPRALAEYILFLEHKRLGK